MLAVNGATARLYKNGVLVKQTTDLTTMPADMGSKMHVYLGKSFYKEDVGFSGAIDNVKIYRTALTQAEIAGEQPKDLRGDVNSDGTINKSDVSALQKYLLTSGTLKAWQQGDLNDDGILTSADLTLLKRIILG